VKEGDTAPLVKRRREEVEEEEQREGGEKEEEAEKRLSEYIFVGDKEKEVFGFGFEKKVKKDLSVVGDSEGIFSPKKFFGSRHGAALLVSPLCPLCFSCSFPLLLPFFLPVFPFETDRHPLLS
jgi:hypothetical protein